jgi:ribose transport system permease protein
VATPARRRPAINEQLARWGGLIGIVVLSIVFSIALPDTFARVDTARILASTQAVLVIVAIGTLFPLIAGEFDLSVGAVTGFASLMLAKMNGTWRWPLVLAVVVAVLVGTAIGLVNGLLVTKLRISSFIATLAMSIILSGLAIWATAGLVISEGINAQFINLGTATILSQVPLAAIFWIGVVAVGWFVLDMTPWGRYLRVTGANPRSARLLGLPVDRIKLQAFVISGMVGGMAGVLHLMQIGSAHPSDGPDLLLPAYAAAFLGSTTIHPGRFNAVGTAVAVFLLAVGITGVQLWGAPSWVEPVFNGGALLIAVGLSVRTSRRVAPA